MFAAPGIHLCGRRFDVLVLVWIFHRCRRFDLEADLTIDMYNYVSEFLYTPQKVLKVSTTVCSDEYLQPSVILHS